MPEAASPMFPGFQRRFIRAGNVTINVVSGGQGPPVLLLHGWPQTHVMWHKIAPTLAADFTVVAPDLRGYGDSDKPPGGGDHSAYSKRTTALDQIEVMRQLGHAQFSVVGHDRGGRVAHRMALDHSAQVKKLVVLDIVPTVTIYRSQAMKVKERYWHWFFLAAMAPLPESLLGNNVDFVMTAIDKMNPGAFSREAFAEYVRCFKNPAAIHAGCEDYRAAGSIDLVHDEADRGKRISCPMLALWGRRDGRTDNVDGLFDCLKEWRKRATRVSGR
jgi:haloacetate dehalogenase